MPEKHLSQKLKAPLSDILFKTKEKSCNSDRAGMTDITWKKLCG
jgi:hypothetical protein